MKKISLACADVPFSAYKNILSCLWSNRLGRGPFVEKLERMACDYFGSRYALAVANGTIADIIMLQALKEMSPGKTEVIVPALTFIAQTNAIIYSGLTPVFIDVGEDFQIDRMKALKAINEKTLCLFPAHLLGKKSELAVNPFGYPSKVPILEDCCEAMGGECIKKKFGTFGVAGAFSMYPSHTITTGEGGLLITNSKHFYEVLKSIHNHGKWGGDDFDFKYFGINGKMTNMQAAIGCANFPNIDKVNRIRKKNVLLFNKYLCQNFHSEAPHCYPVVYHRKDDRDMALWELKRRGIEARKLMGCIPDSEPYKKVFGTDLTEHFPNARRFAECGLFLPVHQHLTRQDIRRICRVIPKP